MPPHVGRLATVTMLAATLLATPAIADAQPTAGSPRFAVAQPVCTAHHKNAFSCLALKLVSSRRGARGARAMTVRPDYATGPAGGYTPSDLATAYSVNPDTATSQRVFIVDAYDDPRAAGDLATFDAQYGLPAETATSFRETSQTGTTSLPAPNPEWAGEESLDIEAVRGICHKCAITLMEADSDSDADLAGAENEAVVLGATIISNSLGEAEPTTAIPAPIVAAFRHPGVVVTAGAGDDGMFNWDQTNGSLFGLSDATSANAPDFPASLNSVVAIGGTTLTLTSGGSRADETVWNEDGDADELGMFLGPIGATGGGCSDQIAAPRWQTALTVWAQTPCGSHRLPVDISAVADPYSGFDVYDSYQSSGWQTVGGTSLASPVIAAMWALAGGSGGVTYPALTLYGHQKTTPSALYDVTSGGNGYCGGVSTTDCEEYVGQSPNTLGLGTLDCAFAPNSEQAAPGTRACDAATGYDGPSGVGTPNGTSAFKAMNPTATIAAPSAFSHGKPAPFSAAKSTDPFPGGSLVTYRWSWGDGTTSTGSAPAHTYARVGVYVVTVNVTDSYQRTGASAVRITVK